MADQHEPKPNDTRVRPREAGEPGLPWVLEYFWEDEWHDWGGGFNTSTAAAWQAHSVFGAPRPVADG